MADLPSLPLELALTRAHRALWALMLSAGDAADDELVDDVMGMLAIVAAEHEKLLRRGGRLRTRPPT